MLDRRAFLQGLVGAAVVAPAVDRSASALTRAPEILYNGITLREPWPPRLRFPANVPIEPPYVANPPAVIPIDIGRQLFVDDFLIEETTLDRACHRATYHPASPVLRPETPWEIRDEYADRTKTPPSPTAMVFSDGVVFDPRERLFKMWYMGGYRMTTCLATSSDGLSWQRPTFRVVNGTNIVQSDSRDSATIWLDHAAARPAERFKMARWDDGALDLFLSPDGVRWSPAGRSGPTGDRSTFFYNPFRRVWVFSLRDARADTSISDRSRRYREATSFVDAGHWTAADPVAWVKADTADFARAETGAVPELYNLDCAAYESVLLGLFTVWRGETNTREKINEVTVGFSRDGFHWSRPDRQALLPVSDREGDWNWANVQSAGGCCLVVGDWLYFYVSGRSGRPGTDLPGTCSTGLATLRRDGFVSMDRGRAGSPRRIVGRVAQAGDLITRPVSFTGRHLFVNVDPAEGELRAEILDRDGRAIPAFAIERSTPVRDNATRVRMRWTGRDDLSDVAGQPVRIRFSLTAGRLYSFWVSAWPTGESRGYVAAGGPGFSGPTDEPTAGR